MKRQKKAVNPHKKGKVKLSKKAQLRKLMVSGKRFSLAVLQTKLGDAPEVTVKGYISDLRSDKYAGAGGKLNITSKETRGKVTYGVVE